MKLLETEVRVPAPDGEILATMITPVVDGPWPVMLLYTDIFQRTESTLRTARRLASAGFVVCVPEIYPHGALAGVALEFDEAGKQSGLAGAASTTTAQFDADRTAVLDFLESQAGAGPLFAVGFCIGGHLAFRAAFDPRISATVCFYPTGLHNGALGADRDAEIAGQRTPHPWPADDRLRLLRPARARRGARPDRVGALLRRSGGRELHVYRGGEHAFMRDVGARHDPVLTDLAITEAVSFLTARLNPARGTTPLEPPGAIKRAGRARARVPGRRRPGRASASSPRRSGRRRPGPCRP